jgi:ligand-binding SRPBCC domain-containing protein
MADVYTLTTWQWFPLSRDTVFPFFAEARNLERLTPALLRFKVLTPAPIQMGPGTLIDYRLSLRGMPMRWRTEITAWQPPVRFEDRQLKGPYRQWLHTHLFDEADGGTTVRDEVRYRLRGPDLLTRPINRLLVQPDVSRIFTYRHDALETALGVTGRSRRGPVSIVRGHL